MPAEEAALRAEVDLLATRIATHLRSGLPPDEQLLGFARKACGLYAQVLASNPPDGQALTQRLRLWICPKMQAIC